MGGAGAGGLGGLIGGKGGGIPNMNDMGGLEDLLGGGGKKKR